MIGAGLFSLTSLLAAFSPSAVLLIAARGLMGNRRGGPSPRPPCR